MGVVRDASEPVAAIDIARGVIVRKGLEPRLAVAAETGPVDLDMPLVAMSTPIIRDRLKRAGVRLAHLLDEALAE